MEITSAHSTIIAATISAIISFVVALWTARSQVRNLIISAQQNALQQIIKARLDVYAGIYRPISQLVKDADSKTIDQEYLEKLRREFDDWDSQNAYLLGPDTTNTAYAFRQILRKAEKLIIGENKNTGLIEDLLEHAEQLELGLRSDLGVYGLQLQRSSSDIRTPQRTSYYEKIDSKP